MKPAFLPFLFLFLFNSVNASEKVSSIENKIIMNMIHSLTHVDEILVYTDSPKIKQTLRNSEIKFVNQCGMATIAIIKTKKYVSKCNNVIVLTLEYDLLNVYPNSVASFFWQKGRPNIVFIEPRLKKQKIIISSKFNDFLEDSIW